MGYSITSYVKIKESADFSSSLSKLQEKARKEMSSFFSVQETEHGFIVGLDDLNWETSCAIKMLEDLTKESKGLLIFFEEVGEDGHREAYNIKDGRAKKLVLTWVET